MIQIPCLNEAETLPMTVRDLPRSLPGVDVIEYLVVDDGSVDNTAQVARSCGVQHVVRFRRNRGLARAFARGLDACLARGADIIVNTDADNQYRGEEIGRLVEPILKGEADIVVGDRQTATIEHFSLVKKLLQRYGSWVVGKFAGVRVPDATSGFRALTREAALELNVVSDFSYTLETLLQAGSKRLKIVHIPIATNGALRPSRLFTSIFEFVKRSTTTLVRVYTTHEPLKVFLLGSVLLGIAALALFVRFAAFFFMGSGSGHVQSLIVAAVLSLSAGFMATVGILADMVNTNRRLIEEILRRERDREPPS